MKKRPVFDGTQDWRHSIFLTERAAALVARGHAWNVNGKMEGAQGNIAIDAG